PSAPIRLPPSPRTQPAGKQPGSDAPRTGIEHVPVEIDVELHRTETVRRPVTRTAEAGVAGLPVARGARVPAEAVAAEPALPDPLAGGLGGRAVRGEGVPAARLGRLQAGAGDPVRRRALRRRREAAAEGVALLDHRAVRVLTAPPGEQGRVLPEAGHPQTV